jgi:hypothetical protein
MARTRLLLSRLRVVPSWLLLRTSNRPKEKRLTANLTPVTRLVVRGSGHVPQLVLTASCSQIGSGTRMRRRRTRVTGPSRISASLYLPRTGADTEHTWLRSASPRARASGPSQWISRAPDMHLLTARDKARLDRLARDVAEYRRLASEADTPGCGKIMSSAFVTSRPRPDSIEPTPSASGSSGCRSSSRYFPGPLLARGGYTPAGLAASALTTVIVIALNVWRRRRSRVTAQ